MSDSYSEADHLFTLLNSHQAYLRGLLTGNYSVRIAGPRRSSYASDYYDEIVCKSFLEVVEGVEALRTAHQTQALSGQLAPAWDAFTTHLAATARFFETMSIEKCLNPRTRAAYGEWGSTKKHYVNHRSQYLAVENPKFPDPYVWIDRSDGRPRYTREVMMLPVESLRDAFRSGGQMAYLNDAIMKWHMGCRFFDHRLRTAFDPPWDLPVGAAFYMTPTWEFQNHPKYRGSAIDVLTEIREEIREKQINYLSASIDNSMPDANRYKAWLDIEEHSPFFQRSFFSSTYAEIAYERFDFELFRDVRGRMATLEELAADRPQPAPLENIGELTEGLFIR